MMSRIGSCVTALTLLVTVEPASAQSWVENQELTSHCRVRPRTELQPYSQLVCRTHESRAKIAHAAPCL